MDYPKCKRCGSKTFLFIRELKSGKNSIFVYQDSNKCIHMLDALIEKTENPMATVGDV
jgi:hypothetical protein